MKVVVFDQAEDVLQVVTFEPGDEPEGMTISNVPPAMVNRHQRAVLELEASSTAIIEHLRATGQEW